MQAGSPGSSSRGGNGNRKNRGANRGGNQAGGSQQASRNRRGTLQNGGNRDGTQQNNGNRGGNRGGNQQTGGNRGGNQQTGGNRGRGGGNGFSNHQQSQYRETYEEPEFGNASLGENPLKKLKRNHQTERKGPVFGFKRLHGFLSSSTDEIILSIDSDITDWKEFLDSEELTSKSETLLVLALQILATKLCGDTNLQRGQLDILTSAASATNFIDKINKKSQKISMGIDLESLTNATRRMNLNSDFVDIDTSAKTFLTSLHTYCSFMVKILPNIAVDFLSLAVGTAFGAVHSDKSYAPLVEKFEELRTEIQALVKEQKVKPKQSYRPQGFGFTIEEEQELHAMEAPEDFRQINIVPTPGELLSRSDVFLRPNKTCGAYNDANHYLDVQFRLQREDFVQPLRKGIQDFMKNRYEYLTKKKKMPLGNIRIYPDVQIISGDLVRDQFIFKVQLSDDNYKHIRWEKSKRLLTGSLLVFTSDLFKSTYFATVATRNQVELSKGILSIIWEGGKPTWDRDDDYLMVECEVYFEPFRHTLQALKELQLENFPMCRFVVYASSDVGPPFYLQNSEHMMKLRLQNHEDKYVSPLIREQWPTNEELGLDVNQFQAFQAAVTNEFAIIQGPPGSGKTFLGLKIAEMFLMNNEIWEGSPILVVCYTNHALDQFLEGIIEIFAQLGDKSPSIVRVGGRSKSERMQHYSLQEVMKRNFKNMPKFYHPNRREIFAGIDELRNERSAVMAAVMGLRDIQGIINFEQLNVWNELCLHFPKALFTSLSSKEWFGFTDKVLRDLPVDEIIKSLKLEIRPFSRGKVTKVAPRKEETLPTDQAKAEEFDEDEEDYDLEELEENRIFDDIYEMAPKFVGMMMGQYLSYIPGFSIEDCERTIRKADHFIEKIWREEPNQTSAQKKGAEWESKRWWAQKVHHLLETLFNLYKTDRIDLPDVSQFIEQMKTKAGLLVTDDLKKLSKPERWAVFFRVVDHARILSAKKAALIDERLMHQQKKLQEIDSFGKGFLLKNSKVVGMTTTGAAKYRELVKMMESKIVIVEEAAEVLESHIVTCLSKHVEHLILIGDHRQLRPSTTVYELAKKFNLDISLFERMINNKLHCYQLKMQHRMRPEIANLVVGTIYDELHNHPSVSHYPPVHGVTKNLFFISHSELEKSETDSTSKSNQFEAKFLSAFCRYLILQGYSSDKITVLTTYTGQMFLLKSIFRNTPNCKDVRITVVDNFQGEENDVILLSLVRSNADSKIGFLNIENRICVAVSRAKHGLFIVGNMKMLASKSKTWTQIEEKLNTRGECGRSLTLECQIHGTLSEVSTDKDFIQKVPEGGCNLLCDTVLKCTHKCVKVCHIEDRNHKKFNCKEPCLKICSNDHPCQGMCFIKCPPCPIPIIKTLLCQHEKLMPCYKNITEVLCSITVEKELSCRHKEEMACHRDPSEIRCCIEMVKELPCKHIKTLKCHQDPSSINCKVTVTKKLVPCGHEQEAECRFAPEHINCTTLVTKNFEKCKHQMQVRCADSNKPLDCKNQCTIRLNCGHSCTKLCHVSDDPEHLTYICKKNCEKECTEGHKCKSLHKCHKPCPTCHVEIERKLPCNHNVKLECYLDPVKYECLERCEKILPCDHQCQSLCFQPCGACQIEVDKKVPECKHLIKIACSVAPSRDKCLEPMKPLFQSACKHDTCMVPCRISQTATHTEVMEYCSRPCKTVFLEDEGGCGHKCAGTCLSCRQRRFHEKCQEKCGKALFCGHVCEFPCSKGCPPCAQQCVMKCEHSECKNKCGTPCQDCCEKCPWQCPHKKCTKLCREMCDREPCDEPCPKIIEKCGHPCIGFCGEPCPPQCRICDKKELTEFQLYSLEEEEDSRFIFLPDCKHAIEVEGLTYHMNMADDEIGVKRCPRCTTVIRSCRRFGNIIKTRLQDVIKVKTKIFGNQKKITENKSTLIAKLRWDEDNRWSRIFPALHDQLMDKLTHQIPVKRGSPEMRIVPKPVDEITLESINLVATYAEKAITVLLKAKTDLRLELNADLLMRYRCLFKMVMERKLPLSRVEVRDIGQELDRLDDLYQVYLRRSSPRFTDGHHRATPIYDLALELILIAKPYTNKYNHTLRTYLTELEETLRTGLGIPAKEVRDILLATGMQPGHWFKCPNGHIYAIGDCGGAAMESTCNECGARIGGSNHQLRRDNALASEMDGAAAPAWPTAMNY